MRESLPYLARLSFSLRLEISTGDDEELESTGWRRGSKKCWLIPDTWSFSQRFYPGADFSAPAVGTSIGRSDAASSLGSTRWPSRISCICGLWALAGLNNTKPLRLYTRTQLLRIFTHSGRRWRNSWNTEGSSRWTIGSRASFGFLRDRVRRDFESQLDVIPEFPEGSIQFLPDGRLPHIPSLIRAAAWEERCNRLCAVLYGLRGSRARGFKSPSGEGAECEEGSEAFAAKQDRRSSEASVPSRIPGNSARSHGRSRCLQSQGVTPILTPCSYGPA